MENTDTVKLIEEKYDEFFGTGYWESEYKKHIVAFTAKCFFEISCLEAKTKALHSMKCDEKKCRHSNITKTVKDGFTYLHCDDCGNYV